MMKSINPIAYKQDRCHTIFLRQKALYRMRFNITKINSLFPISLERVYNIMIMLDIAFDDDQFPS